MDLNELIFIGACSIISRHRHFPIDVTDHVRRDAAITMAVHLSKRVWKEVIEKKREDADGNS